MPLAPFDLFPGVVASLAFNLCRFHALTVQAPSGRVFVAPRFLPNARPQRVVKPPPRAVVPPLAKIMIHTLPLPISPRQQPPLNSPNYDIQDGVQYLAHV